MTWTCSGPQRDPNFSTLLLSRCQYQWFSRAQDWTCWWPEYSSSSQQHLLFCLDSTESWLSDYWPFWIGAASDSSYLRNFKWCLPAWWSALKSQMPRLVHARSCMWKLALSWWSWSWMTAVCCRRPGLAMATCDCHSCWSLARRSQSATKESSSPK